MTDAIKKIFDFCEFRKNMADKNLERVGHSSKGRGMLIFDELPESYIGHVPVGNKHCCSNA